MAITTAVADMAAQHTVIDVRVTVVAADAPSL